MVEKDCKGWGVGGGGGGEREKKKETKTEEEKNIVGSVYVQSKRTLAFSRKGYLGCCLFVFKSFCITPSARIN